MATDSTLCEVQNYQRRSGRSKKTYGRKKGTTINENQAVYQQLFGGDENDFEQQFSKLRIDIEETKQDLVIESGTQKRGKSKTNQRPSLPVCEVTSTKPERLHTNEDSNLHSLLQLAEQEIEDFEELGRTISKKFMCRKLGEGSFAEVFKLLPRKVPQKSTSFTDDGFIIKIIPFNLDSDQLPQCTVVDSVIREVKILQLVASLHGFARFRGLRIVRGKWPAEFRKAYLDFKEIRPDAAINDDPTECYSDTQLYAVLEMDDAGIELDQLGVPSVFQIYDIFWMTTVLLANAEDQADFEHRDLHVSNICYKSLHQDGRIDMTKEDVKSMSTAPIVRLGLTGLDITIIDYTLSRARMSERTDDIAYDPIKLWSNNNAKGRKAEDKIQFEAYRKARNCALLAEHEARRLAEKNGDSYMNVDKWSRFVPKTNVVWLGALLTSLVGRYDRARKKLVPGSNNIAKDVQKQMLEELREVLEYICNPDIADLPISANQFLRTSVERNWLPEAELSQFTHRLEADS